MKSLPTPTTLSRRNWLRDAAIVTTGAAVMPSLLTGCTDHRVDPGNVGLGRKPTLEELQKAAQNLTNMEAWRSELYDWTFKYQDDVYHMIQSGKQPSGWESFVVTVFTDIAIAIAGAALAAAEIAAPYAAPVIAIAGATLIKWGLGQDSPGFPGAFSAFEDGHLKIQKALSTMLTDLAGTNNDYAILRKRWNDVYEFNGHKYTISDLASEKSHFPAKSEGTPYTDLLNPAYDSFRRNIWNVMFVKSAYMYYVSYWGVDYKTGLWQYGINEHYPQHPETYLRGYYDGHIFKLTYFYFMIDGKYLSAGTAKELFIDDSIGHIINPDDKGKPKTGLFARDHVFKQFHREKPDFKGYLDVKPNSDHTQPEKNLDPNSDNYVFTGGGFPQLINK